MFKYCLGLLQFPFNFSVLFSFRSVRCETIKKACFLLDIVPDPHHLASWSQIRIPIEVKSLIRIRIKVKSRIRIHIRGKSRRLWRLSIEPCKLILEPWRLTVELWKSFCQWMHTGIRVTLGEEPNPESHQTEKFDSDPHYLDADPLHC